MRTHISLSLGVLAVAATGGALYAQAAGNGLSTRAGVYSEAQARRGETVYRSACLECHVPTDYTGDAFDAKFVGGTAFDMFDLIRSTMPQSNPGGLSNAQYTDVVAYLFKLNGFPVRAADMPAVPESLKAIKVESKDPQMSQRQLRTQGVRPHHGSSRIR